MRSFPLLPQALLVLLATPVIAGLDISVAAEIRLGRVPPPPPPEVVVIAEPAQPGPPPWAPAHGFRRNRAYYYYPGADVYYRPADRMWIYLDGRDWRFGVSLPTGIRLDFDRCVSLTMETDKPYEFHDKVRTFYPADYFTKKVRVKEKGAKADQAKGGRGDMDQADEGNRGEAKGNKGKGRNKDK